MQSNSAEAVSFIVCTPQGAPIARTLSTSAAAAVHKFVNEFKESWDNAQDTGFDLVELSPM